MVRNVIQMLWCRFSLDIYFLIMLQFTKASDKEELKTIVESYQETLRNKANPKNLRKFVESFLKSVSFLSIFLYTGFCLFFVRVIIVVLVISSSLNFHQ